MCGIAGIYSLKAQPLDSAEKRIMTMMRHQQHRGPDYSGFKISQDKRLAIAHSRLSIVDPNTMVKSPFSKGSNTEILSFNGEIYNYKDLKKLLLSKGIEFQTDSDTEVLFECLKFFQDDVYQKIQGMWGFAFYSCRENKLILSRDLLGERHIFYDIENNELIFASEAKAVVSVLQNRSFDFNESINSIMYQTASPGNTLTKEVKRLLPGEELIIRNGKIKKRIYKKLNPERWFDFFQSNTDFEDILARFNEIFMNSIQSVIPSDVSFITTQSGGIDSTLINTFLKRSGKSFESLFGFSVSESDPIERDEYEAALTISKKLGFNLHKVNMVNKKSQEILKDVAKDCFDGCIDDGVANFRYLSDAAKKLNSKVLILADGADDFVGYKRDRHSNFLDKLYQEKKSIYIVSSIISRLFPDLMMRVFNGNYFVEEVHSYSPMNSRVNHQIHTKNFLGNIFNKDSLQEHVPIFGVLPDYYNLQSRLDFASNRSLAYAAKTTPDMFNLRVDKAFYKSSIEVRLPFQNPDLVEFLIALPSYLKFGNGNETKFFLRAVIEKNISKKFAQRRKTGFASHLYNDEEIYNAMNMKETIVDSGLFQNDFFIKSSLDFMLDESSNKGLRYSAYSLAQTYKQLTKSEF